MWVGLGWVGLRWVGRRNERYYVIFKASSIRKVYLLVLVSSATVRFVGFPFPGCNDEDDDGAATDTAVAAVVAAVSAAWRGSYGAMSPPSTNTCSIAWICNRRCLSAASRSLRRLSNSSCSFSSSILSSSSYCCRRRVCSSSRRLRRAEASCARRSLRDVQGIRVGNG